MQILKRYVLANVILDYFAALFAWFLFYLARKINIENLEISSSQIFSDNNLLLGLAIVPLFWLALYLPRYDTSTIRNKQGLNEFFLTLGYSIMGVIILFFILLIDDQINTIKDYYKLFFTLLSIHFSVTLFFRFLILWMYNHQIHNKSIQFNTLIVGDKDKILEVVQELSYINRGNNIVGYISAKKLDNIEFHYIHNNFTKEITDQYQIDEVIIALNKTEHNEILNILHLLQNSQVVIKTIPDVYTLLYGSVRINHLLSPLLIEIDTVLLKPWQKILKNVFDNVIAFLALLIFSPIMLIIALILKTRQPGKVLYKQERIGYRGKPFTMYKFKTMYDDAELSGPQLSSTNDLRVTPIGKFLRKYRLDELPNLWNVVKGEMSIVGPRPERSFFIDKIVEKAPEFEYLQKVKPGITSWGMVRYGYASSIEEIIKRMKYDLLYIENLSIFLDLKILLYTIWIVIQGRGK